MTHSPSGKKPDKPDSRGQRLAAALRENLSRRKAQARARRAEGEHAGGAEEEKPSTQPPRGNKP